MLKRTTQLLARTGIAALALNTSLALAQTAECNHFIEQPGQGPGKIPGSEILDNCVQININGNLVTPAQCVQGYTHFSIQQHSCAAGPVSVHCDFDKYKVLISKFDGGGCPQLPDLSGIDWSTIGGVFAALPRILTALVCQPPKKEEEKSDSAASNDCTTGEGEEPIEGEVIAATTEGTALSGGATAQTTDGPAGLFNPFMTPYESAQTATPQDFGGPLGAVAAAQAGVEGMEFHASLLVEHFDDASSNNVSSSREIIYWGKICADGRFDVNAILPATYDGKPSPTMAHTTFDGHHLRSFIADSETGNQFDLTGSVSDWVNDVYFEGLREAYMWCVDTYDIPLFPNVSYDVNPGGEPDTVAATRSHPLVGGGSFVSEQYVLSTRVTPTVPLSRSDFDVAGFAWTTYEYSNFTEFRTGDLRPLVTKATRYFGDANDRRKVATTLRITTAKPLTSAEAILVPSMMSDDIAWVTWTF